MRLTALYSLLALFTIIMADNKKAIIKFKKGASAEDKAKLIDQLKAGGAEVTNGDHINSSIMSFVAVSIPQKHYDSLHSDSLTGGHNVVEHIEEDGEMHTM